MNLSEYQEAAESAANYADRGGPLGFTYALLRLTAEAAEVVQIISKALSHKHGKLEPEVLAELKKELGDVLCCVAEIGSQLNFDLSEVAQINLESLKERGTLQGSGDDR